MCPTLKSPGCQTAQRAAAAEAENERLREALREIAEHPSCWADTKRIARTPVGIMARAALQEAPRHE